MRYFIFFFLCWVIGGCALFPSKNFPSVIGQESPYKKLNTLKEGGILHVPTGVELTEGELLDFLGRSRVIYVGEVHSNLQHHKVQLKILKELLARFLGKIAVGMEMFQRKAQPALDRWGRGELSDKEFSRLWYENWSQGLGYYQEILDFIAEAKIPLVALNASDEMISLVAKSGLDGVPDEFKKELPELDQTDSFHRKSLEAVFGGHSHGKEGFDRFYRTMLLWDETMAETIVDYLNGPQGKGKKLVVLAGGFHVAYGYGIPRRVFRRLPEPYTVVLPHTAIEKIPKEREGLLMDVTPPQLPLYIADFVWEVGYEALKEDRVYLGVQIDQGEEGVIVIKVFPGLPASKAGIKVGDVIRSLEGIVIEAPFDLTYEVTRHKTGDRVSIEILRDGEPMALEATFFTKEN